MTLPWQHLLKLREPGKPERNRPRLDSYRRWDYWGGRDTSHALKEERRENHR